MIASSTMNPPINGSFVNRSALNHAAVAKSAVVDTDPVVTVRVYCVG